VAPVTTDVSSEGADGNETLLEELKATAKANPVIDRMLRSMMRTHIGRGEELEELRRKNAELEEINSRIVAENARLTTANRDLVFRSDLQEEMKAIALQKAHVAMLMVDPARGNVVYANGASDALFGTSVGTNVFALFLNTLMPYAQDPSVEDSVVRPVPEPYGKTLWQGAKEAGKVIYERVHLRTVMKRGAVDTVLVIQTIHDGNGHPWILFEAMEIERLNKDAMTGLYRREVAIAALTRELSHRERVHIDLDIDPISVIMMDIDDFKGFNTLYEYEGGDKVLKRIAGIIGDEIREKDLACRWFSGDEFLIVLYGDAQAATFVAERICRRVKELVVQVRERSGKPASVKVGVSVGVTGRQVGDDWESISKRAEAELTNAKIGGKGRVSSTRIRALKR
jgi:diguanylate cyclase (GGDEF)-like protein